SRFRVRQDCVWASGAWPGLRPPGGRFSRSVLRGEQHDDDADVPGAIAGGPRAVCHASRGSGPARLLLLRPPVLRPLGKTSELQLLLPQVLLQAVVQLLRLPTPLRGLLPDASEVLLLLQPLQEGLLGSLPVLVRRRLRRPRRLLAPGRKRPQA